MLEVIIGDCLCGQPERVERKDGKDVIIRCPLWIKLKGRNPQDPDEKIDHWGCAISWIPVLLIEQHKSVIEQTKGLDNLRNDLAKFQEASYQRQMDAQEIALRLAEMVNEARNQVGFKNAQTIVDGHGD